MTDKTKAVLAHPLFNTIVMALLAALVAMRTADYKLETLEKTVHRIDQRVSEMYCNSLPPDKRAGCR